MLPCKGCGYQRRIPGDEHIECAYRWDLDPVAFERIMPGIQKARKRAKIARWFRWPFNFDPMWGPEECQAFSAVGDPDKIRPQTGFGVLLTLLGRRL